MTENNPQSNTKTASIATKIATQNAPKLQLKAIEDLNNAKITLNNAYKALTGTSFEEQLVRFQLAYAEELSEKALHILKNNYL